MENYLETFMKNVVGNIPNLIAALLIFLISVYVGRLLGNIIWRVLAARKAPEGVTHLLTQFTRWTFIVFGAIAALQRFFDVTAFLAGLGLVGFTVGFALQDVMKNFAAGIILLLQQPFQVGEAIGVKDFDGTVLGIHLRTTEMKTFDGRIVTLPNADLLANPIVNYTRADRRRVEIPVRISYQADPEIARQAALEAIQTVPGMVNDPEPVVGFSTFDDSALKLNAYFWIDTSKTNPLIAKDDALKRMKSALEQKGIEIPFPTQTVYMRSPS
ncbi:MAG: mechanosensitive ion channel [Anaerolineales bacterium]|nr:MAG: mechanosensitive ion channel [Anaerolineales bacterium]